jgi:DNA-directed RNA polymerase III subunit RPC8
MFLLAVIEDTVRIPPSEFDAKELEAVKFQINNKYSNRVLENVGLCIKLYDILDVGDGIIMAGDGGSHTRVKFRMIIFKPFLGEILVGRIKECTQDYIRVSVLFFEHIYIPASFLPDPSTFDEGKWVWQYGEHELTMEVDKIVRCRVESVQFNPPSVKSLMFNPSNNQVITPSSAPTAANTPAPAAAAAGDNKTTAEHVSGTTTDHALVSPIIITASTYESGMGMVDWWAPTDEEPLLKIITYNEAMANAARASMMQAEEVNASTEQLEDTDAVADQMAVDQEKGEEGEENELIDGANDAHSDAGGAQDE